MSVSVTVILEFYSGLIVETQLYRKPNCSRVSGAHLHFTINMYYARSNTAYPGNDRRQNLKSSQARLLT